MVETLQNDYGVNIAGPSTMAALLNSLQMGFRTLKIQKSSSEVWKILGEVKTEFGKFDKILETAQNRIRYLDADLDALRNVRTRAINRKLRDVEIPDAQDASRLPAPDEEAGEDSGI